MQILHSAVASFTVLALASQSAAEPPKRVTLSEVATDHCPLEWAKIPTKDLQRWASAAPFTIDPKLPTMTTESFNKYASAVIVLADYMSVFIGFANPNSRNATYVSMAKAKYDLATCLTPTPQERALIIELSAQVTTISEKERDQMLFKTFNKFDCMQFAKASEAIFDLDPATQLPSLDFTAITQTHMKTCD